MVETTRRYRVGLDLHRYYLKFMIACVSCLVMGVGATLAVGWSYFYDHDEQLVADYVEQLELTETEHEKAMNAVAAQHSIETREQDEQYAALEAEYDELQTRYDELNDQSSADFTLMRRYWYVFRYAPDNGYITLDLIRHVDNQCKKWNINPDIMWHIYWQESTLNPRSVNSTTGATGFGQVLPSTGQLYWTKVLGRPASTYSNDKLFDPFVNVELTTAHLGRDLENGASFMEAIDHYSGGGGQAYWNSVVSKALAHGIVISANNYKYQ